MAEQFDDVFGTAQVGGGEYLKAVKIRQGLTQGRVIPPVKSQKTTGKWSMYHAVHYGYYGTNKKDANGKPWAKPFLCIQEKDIRTQMITRECPKCEQVKVQEGLAKAREGEIRAEMKGRPEDAIKSTLRADPTFKSLAEWLKQHNVDRHHYINLKLADGTVECTKIPGKGKKALDEEIKKLKAKKIDPFDPRAGVYFDFERSGEKTDTSYKVTVAKEEFKAQDGNVYERTKMAPLTATDVELIKSRAMDLATAHGATILTDSQIKSLVECDEDPATVDSIFDQATPVVQEQAKSVAKATTPPPAAKPAVKPAPAPAPAPKAEDEAPFDADVVIDPQAALKAQIAALQAQLSAPAAKPAPAKAAVKPAAPAPASAAPASADEMDPDSFIAEFGDPG